MAEMWTNGRRTVIEGDDALDEALQFLRAEADDPRDVGLDRVELVYDE